MRFTEDIGGVFSINHSTNSLFIKGIVWASMSNTTIHMVDKLKKHNISSAKQEFVEWFTNGKKEWLRDIDGSFMMALQDPILGGILYRSLECRMSLYYRVEREKLYWSSNPIDLVDKHIPLLKQVNRQEVFVSCLGGFLNEEQSHYKGIRRLPAGHLLVYKDGHYIVEELDVPRIQKETSRRDIWSYAEEARYLIQKTLARRLEKGKTIGIQLSGGMDSSALLCSLKELGASVVAYHLSCEGIRSADETKYARLVANHFDVPLYEVHLPTEINANTYLNYNWRFRTPLIHSCYRGLEMVQEKCQEHGINTIIPGYMGDFVFAPVNKPSFAQLWNALSKRELIHYLWEKSGCQPYFSDKKTVGFSRTKIFEPFFTDSALDEISQVNDCLEFSDHLIDNFRIVANDESESTAQTRLFKQNILSNFVFSREIMEFSLRIPDVYKITPSSGQWIIKPVLRLAYLDSLPKEIITRNHDQLFNSIDENYIVHQNQQIASFLCHSHLVEFGIIDRNKIQTLLSNKRTAASVTEGLMNCLMMEIWLRNLNKLSRSQKKMEVGKLVSP